MSASHTLLLLLALALMLFCPGFLLSIAFLKQADRWQRLALAPALSLAATALTLLVIEKTAARFTATNVAIALLALNACCALLAWLQWRRQRSRSRESAA